MITRPNKQTGVALATAIMVLLILMVIATTITRLSVSQKATVVLDVMQSQALYAARAGSEWAVYQVTNPGKTPSAIKSDMCRGDKNMKSYVLPPDMTFTVLCSVSVETDTQVVYALEITACNIPSSGKCPGNLSSENYVERKVAVLAERTK